MTIKQFFKDALSALGRKKQTAVKSADPQSDERAAQSIPLNYMSVQTLDPSRLSRAFTAADNGEISEQMAIYELIEERDIHVTAELAKRRRAITGLSWQLRPPKDASQSEVSKTQELTEMIASIPGLEDAIYDMTDGIFKGFTAQEIRGWSGKDVWIPTGFVWVPQRTFKIDTRTNKLLYLKDGIAEELWSDQWLIHEHRTKSGYLEQVALGRVIAWAYAFKAFNIIDMQRYLERYGMPLVVGKYLDGATKEQRDALMRAVRNIGHDGAGVISQQMAIEFVQATSGKTQDFHDSIEYWERKQSIAILGSTLTSQADRGSNTNALGQVHDKVRREIMLHDVRQIEPTLSLLVKKVALVNGMFPEGRVPTFHFDTAERVDQEMMAKVLQAGVSIGMKISVETAHELLQIPMAADTDEILSVGYRSNEPQETEEPEKEEDEKKASATAVLSQKVNPEEERFSLDNLTEELTQKGAVYEEQYINQIWQILSECSDFDEAAERLTGLKPDLDKYAELIAGGMSAAHLAGRASVGEKS